MSETRSSGVGVTRRELFKITAVAAASIALAACTGKSGGTRETVVLPAPNHDAIHSPEAVAQALEAAGLLAASYQEALNLDGVVRGVSVLNGTIRQAASDSQPAYEFKNPILLSESGEFTDGSVLGIQSNDEAGRVMLNAVIFNTDRHTFTPDASKETVFQELEVRAIYTGVGEETEHLELFAFEPGGGGKVIGTDGMPIAPGMAYEVQ